MNSIVIYYTYKELSSWRCVLGKPISWMQEAYNEHQHCAESGRSAFGVVILMLEWLKAIWDQRIILIYVAFANAIDQFMDQILPGVKSCESECWHR